MIWLTIKPQKLFFKSEVSIITVKMLITLNIALQDIYH